MNNKLNYRQLFSDLIKKVILNLHPNSRGDYCASVFLILWFSILWSWIFLTDSIDLTDSIVGGYALKIAVILINVTISFIIIWISYKHISRYIINDNNILLSSLVSLPILALVDFTISWMVALFWIGPEGVVDNMSPVTSPTLLLINTPLAPASRFLGFYGLGAIFWLTLILFSRKSTIKYGFLTIVTALTFAAAGDLLYRDTDGSNIKTTIVSESIDQRVGRINPTEAELIIFPEYGLNNASDSIKSRIKTDTGSAYYVGSEQVIAYGEKGYYNQLIFGNTEQGTLSIQNKYRLIPGGEDLPYVMHAALTLSMQKHIINYFDFAKYTINGSNQLQPLRVSEDIEIGAALCSSIISTEDYRQFTRSGSTILTNSASLGVFGGSSVFKWQQKSLAKFMSIANSRPFAQSANDSVSYVIDNNGNTVAEISGINSTVVDINTNTKITPYTYLGEYLVVTGVIFLLISVLRKGSQGRPGSPSAKRSGLKVK